MKVVKAPGQGAFLLEIVMSKDVLVLNGNGAPLSVVTLADAWGLIEDGVVYTNVTDAVAGHLRSAHRKHPIPSVLMLKKYEDVPEMGKSWSKKGVLKRDNYTCGYCGLTPPSSELTIDHIIPQSRGGPNTWGNTIAACFSCNQRKANKTPSEAGMKLLWEPKTPRTNYLVLSGNVPREWKVFLRHSKSRV